MSSQHNRKKAVAAGLALVSASVVGAAAGQAGAATTTLTPPDMQMQVPTNAISIGNDSSTGDRMLRFTHITADLGAGPFELDPSYNSGTGTATFTQAIYNSSSPGKWTFDHSVPVAATGVFDAPSDYQFPLTSFTLRSVNTDGSVGPVVARSPKTDYCITGDAFVGGVPNAPNQTSPPESNCTDPTKPLGWSVGWGDQYDQTDRGQPIDLTGVSDGSYILRGIVDPDHVLTESNPNNNVTDTTLTIVGNTVTVGAQTHPNVPLPTVTVSNPTSGQTVSGTVTISVTAGATAPATVSSVQMLLDGAPLGAPLTSAPYTYSWTVGSAAPGPHYMSARVTDSAGTINTAQSVQITVAAPAGVPSIDAKASATGHGMTSVTGFSTSNAGDLLVAFVGSDGRNNQTSTVSGAGLTWSLVKRANGEPGDAEIWKATASGTLSGATITSTPGQSGFDQQLTVVAYSSASGTGATGAASSGSTAPTVNLNATSPNSIGVATGNNYDAATAPTLGSGQELLAQFVDSGTGDTYWTQSTVAGSGAAGSAITLSDTSPTGDRTNFAAAEVVASPSSPPPDTLPPTVSIANPTQGQTVSGTIPVSANASDDVAVKSVQFFLDGQPLGGPVTSAPYSVSWDTTTASQGSHSLTATATDTGNLSSTSAAVTVTVQNPAPPMTCFVLQAQVSAHGHGTVTTPSFHTAATGEVLLAFVSSDGPDAAGGQTVTVSGAGLTWTPVKRANGQAGDAEVWTATAPSVLTSVTVTSTPGKSGYDQDLTVVAMEGAAGVGTSVAASASGGAPTVSVTTTGPAASLVFAVGDDWDNAVARTLPSGQVLLDQWVDTAVGDTYWTQYTNQAVSPAGTVVTMKDTAPSSDRWNMVAVELVGDTA